ncbi:MAG: response regulator [Candidatus Scalindua sp. AMX11]|nr:MAG: response regulator [Candidatus Scalindua sp.]NOG84341.1 response regulator [Planctomycetota bacterium]RZV74422.1 MAG: response regulator [Candidatus Scalindua sp. SCAELEC01]TDE65342.1 MAG: response regulator [Candidatus Scalindua sp. AMX11]GJQ60833.1 MAG: hypothetical protein SCALA701_36340 [Candidatus Scalindua sp.]
MITILCVDDSKKQRLLYEQELNFAGNEVITAASGKEALDKVQWLHPDIIIMDINRPDMESLGAIGRIIGKSKRNPIIIHTAHGSHRDTFLSWAVNAYIVKSPDLTELKSKIEALITEESAFALNEVINTNIF